MSEHMFGVTREKITQREYDRRNRICIEEGGHGYTEIHDPGQGWLGWFSGPNRGEPFDRQLERRVLDRVEAPAQPRAKARRRA